MCTSKTAAAISATAAAAFVLAAHLVVAQDPTPTPGQVDASATCPYQLMDQIQACRATVYADEAQLPGGPCHDGDWPCICNVQQGLVACYAPCPGTAPQSDVDYNNANCAGQNGVTNAAARPGGTEYSGPDLTTTTGGAATATSSNTGTAATSGTDTTSATSIASSSTSSIASSSSVSSSSSGSSTPAAAAVNGTSSTPPPAQTSGGSVFDGSKGAAVRLGVQDGAIGVQAGLLAGLLAVLAVAQL